MEIYQNLKPLVLKIKQGDPNALNRLCKIWYPRVYRYAYRFTGNEDTAKEASQMTFMSVTKSIHGLKDVDRFAPWIFKIAANHCRSLYRNKKLFEDESVLSTSISSDSDPYRKLERLEKIEQVKSALMTIPQNQREVIILKEYEGLKFKEIAAILEISENTVKARMYYGLNALKKTLIKDKSQYHEAS